jgi:hypothetical protein
VVMAYRRREWSNPVHPTERETEAMVLAVRTVEGVIDDTQVDRLIVVVRQRRR